MSGATTSWNSLGSAMPTVVVMLGVVVLGIDLARSVEVAQVARDGDAMFVRGLDFSQSGNQQVLVRIAGPLNLQLTGGNGLASMSKITFIPDPSCGTPTDSSYPNCIVGKNVLMQRSSSEIPRCRAPTIPRRGT